MKNKNEELINKVSEILETGGKSKGTIVNYVHAISRFLKYFSKKNVEDFTENDIIEYFKKNYLDKECAANTYNMNLSAVKLFYSICFNKEFNNKLLPRTKIIKRLPVPIDNELFNKVFNAETNLKHKCFLALAFYSGLRVEEITTVKIENIISKEHKIKILGKGKKERFTFLSDVTIECLRKYYKTSGMTKKAGYLFEGYSSREHLCNNSITDYFSRIKRIYNINDDVTFHSLRHSFSTNFIKNGGELFQLKLMLGHTSLNTTSIYIHTGMDFNNLKGVTYGK